MKGWIIEKNYNERHVYESVGERLFLKYRWRRIWPLTLNLEPSAHKSERMAKTLILNLEGIFRKISYERRYYVSVDEKSLSQALSRKATKQIQALKGNSIN